MAPLSVLVVGATGSVGVHVVAETLAAGHRVRALVRDPRARLPADVEGVVGDLTKPATLAPAVTGVDAVVFVHGSKGGEAGTRDTFYAGVRNVLDALAGRRIRIALMTAIAVTDRGRSHDWKRRAERLVRASGCPYVVVRPGWFDLNGPRQQRLVALQGDRRRSGTAADGAVGRRQIARVLLAGLQAGGPPGRTFELVAEQGAEQDVAAFLGSIRPDEPGGLDGVADEANMPMNAEPAEIAAELNTVRASPDAA